MDREPERIAGVTDVDLSGRRALVTGSTSGIGRETALALARLGADVVVHGRDPEAGAEVVDELEAAGADARFVRADFADVDAVRDLAATVREGGELDLLFNNAGGLFRDPEVTDLGVEYTFHVNHLAPYLLTAELLDSLAPDGRVVTTSSAAHRNGDLDLDRVTEPTSGFGAYGRSKLANVLFAAELARRLTAAGRSITSNSVHPGAIPGSGFNRFLPGPLSSLTRGLSMVPGVPDVEDGAAELLFVGVSPRTADVTGRYFASRSVGTPSRLARDHDLARELWERSADLLGIETPLADAGASASDAGETGADGAAGDDAEGGGAEA